jgi:hypothetical protein
LFLETVSHITQPPGSVHHLPGKRCLPPHVHRRAATVAISHSAREAPASPACLHLTATVRQRCFQVRADRACTRSRLALAWSRWQLLIRGVHAMQRLRLRLRRLRKLFRAWAAAALLQRAVLAALSEANSQDLPGGSSARFVRARAQAPASVQTVRMRSHPSLPVVIYRLASHALAPYLRAWRHAARRTSALRWGRRLACKRVMRVWAFGPKAAATRYQYIDESDSCEEERTWSDMISPKIASALGHRNKPANSLFSTQVSAAVSSHRDFSAPSCSESDADSARAASAAAASAAAARPGVARR